MRLREDPYLGERAPHGRWFLRLSQVQYVMMVTDLGKFFEAVSEFFGGNANCACDRLSMSG